MAIPSYFFSDKGDVLTIKDSFLVSKSRFQGVLNSIKALHGAKPIFQRSDLSLKREWAAHNAAYALHYKREQTKDVDLDIPCDKPEWLYIVFGTIVWPFIK